MILHWLNGPPPLSALATGMYNRGLTKSIHRRLDHASTQRQPADGGR